MTEYTTSFVRPLQLERELTPIDRSFDVIPLIDVLLIAFFFSLLGSRFIFAPGVQVDLPTVAADSIVGLPTVAVLTIKEDNMLLFQGNIHTIASFEAAMRNYLQDSGTSNAVLLLKPSRTVSMQTFLSVCEIANSAGFRKVHIAAEANQADEQHPVGAPVAPAPSLPLP